MDENTKETKLEYSVDSDGVEHVVKDGQYVGTRETYENSLKAEPTAQADPEKQDPPAEPTAQADPEQQNPPAEPTAQAEPAQQTTKTIRPGQRERREAYFRKQQELMQQQLLATRRELQELQQQQQQTPPAPTFPQIKQKSPQEKQVMTQYVQGLEEQLRTGQTPLAPDKKTALTMPQAMEMRAEIYKELAMGSQTQPIPQAQETLPPAQEQHTLSPAQEAELMSTYNNLAEEIITKDGDPSIVQDVPHDIAQALPVLDSPADFVMVVNDALTHESRMVAEEMYNLIQEVRFDEQGQPRNPMEVSKMLREIEVGFLQEELEHSLKTRLAQKRQGKTTEQARDKSGKFVKSKAKPSGKPEQGGTPAGHAAKLSGHEKSEDESWDEYHQRRDQEIIDEKITEARHMDQARKQLLMQQAA